MTDKNERHSGEKTHISTVSMLEMVAKMQALSGKPIVSSDVSVVTAEQLVADEIITQPTNSINPIRKNKIK
jgi:hypothetical protein